MSNGYNRNMIPGSPDSLWGWTSDPQLRAWQDRVSTGMAGFGVAGTAMGQLEMLNAGVQPRIIFIDLLRRMNGS